MDPDSNLTDIASYLKQNLVKGLDEKEDVGPVSALTHEQVKARAVEFEVKCNKNLPRMDALPETQEERDN